MLARFILSCQGGNSRGRNIFSRSQSSVLASVAGALLYPRPRSGPVGHESVADRSQGLRARVRSRPHARRPGLPYSAPMGLECSPEGSAGQAARHVECEPCRAAHGTPGEGGWVYVGRSRSECLRRRKQRLYGVLVTRVHTPGRRPGATQTRCCSGGRVARFTRAYFSSCTTFPPTMVSITLVL